LTPKNNWRYPKPDSISRIYVQQSLVRDTNRETYEKITLLLVKIFTFLFSTISCGEWSYVEEIVNGDKFSYSKDRVRKNKKFLYLWDLVDFPKPDEFVNLSVTRYIQLDCSVIRSKNFKLQVYKKSMGEGEMTDSTPRDETMREFKRWKYPKPDSSGEELLNKICEEHQ